ncbi:MAG: hypothetical protein ACREQR_03020 [Candidatus Binataceae bacterium]
MIAFAMLVVLAGREYTSFFKNALPTYLVPLCAFFAGLILARQRRPAIAG